MNCIKCGRGEVEPIEGNIYIMQCPNCGNLQSKDAHKVNKK